MRVPPKRFAHAYKYTPLSFFGFESMKLIEREIKKKEKKKKIRRSVK